MVGDTSGHGITGAAILSPGALVGTVTFVGAAIGLTMIHPSDYRR